MKGLLFGYLLLVVPMNIAVYRGRGRAFRYLESLWASLVFYIIFMFVLGILWLLLGLAKIEVPPALQYILFVAILAGLGYWVGAGMAYDDNHPQQSSQRHQRGTVVSAARSLTRPWRRRGTPADRD